KWHALCEATGHPHWLADPRFATFADRQQHRVALEAVLSAWTVQREAREIVLCLQAAGVPAHRVSSSADVLRDPQLRFRGHFVTVEHPMLGPVLVEDSRLRFSHARTALKTAGPTIGQHNDLVLHDLVGLSDAEIDELKANG